MFFIFSKLFFFLVDPLTWILCLVAAGIFTKPLARQKKFLWWALGLFLFFTNPFVFQKVSLWYQPQPKMLAPTAKYGLGVLLGGMSYYDKANNGFFGSTADRFIQTANLYHSGNIKKILVSGASGSLYQKDPDEAGFLYTEFQRNGIPASDIIVERRSRNTHENAVFSKQIMDSLGIQDSIVLITSAQHMPRSVAVFRKAGFKKFIPYPVDFQEIDKKWEPRTVFIPDAEKLQGWRSLIKEWVGILAYRLTGKI
ncbi:MAG: YdcF family protein [Sphingobacteriia bacterium]|nr:MAG: YdcF family protein [Sphingobacteriia bacterium]